MNNSVTSFVSDPFYDIANSNVSLGGIVWQMDTQLPKDTPLSVVAFLVGCLCCASGIGFYLDGAREEEALNMLEKSQKLMIAATISIIDYRSHLFQSAPQLLTAAKIASMFTIGTNIINMDVSQVNRGMRLLGNRIMNLLHRE